MNDAIDISGLEETIKIYKQEQRFLLSAIGLNLGFVTPKQ